MNNYEKIKSKSLDEMADYLAHCVDCEYCNFQEKCETQNYKCTDVLKQWLQQEASE